MTDDINNEQSHSSHTIPEFGYELLRNQLIPELLGEDEEAILYWAGKSLARKNRDLIEKEGLQAFFAVSNWGNLKVVKESKRGRVYELASRHQDKSRPFSLEAGFLSQSAEMEHELICEASYEIKRKKPLTITVTVKWDLKDPVNVPDSL